MKTRRFKQRRFLDYFKSLALRKVNQLTTLELNWYENYKWAMTQITAQIMIMVQSPIDSPREHWCPNEHSRRPHCCCRKSPPGCLMVVFGFISRIWRASRHFFCKKIFLISSKKLFSEEKMPLKDSNNARCVCCT